MELDIKLIFCVFDSNVFEFEMLEEEKEESEIN